MSSVNLSTHESYGISWDFCLCSLPRKQAVWLSKQNKVNLTKTYGVFFTWSWTSGSVNIQIRKLNPRQTGICFGVASISEVCAAEFIDLELVNNTFGKEMTYLFIYFIPQSSFYDITFTMIRGRPPESLRIKMTLENFIKYKFKTAL